MVTLALNIAEPLIAGRYGKAAFDAVGPLLLIGWAEVGPGLLYAMQSATADRRPVEPLAADGSGSVVQRGRSVPVPEDEPVQDGPSVAGSLSRAAAREARRQDLLHRARAEDVLHWQHYQRPISAETLRKRLRVGADTARALVAQVRSDTRLTLDSRLSDAAST
jgi:hypothetical protein